MAKNRKDLHISKRSKHLKVQDNPFRPTEPPKPISPAKKNKTGTSNGMSYDNSSYSAELEQYHKDHTPTVSLDKAKHQIIFNTVGSNNKLTAQFYSFLESLTESFSLSLAQTEKLGSPESVQQYTSTAKTLSFSWKAFEDDYPSSGNTLSQRISNLKSMLYPEVDHRGNPKKPPVVELQIFEKGIIKQEYSTNPKKGTFDKKTSAREDKTVFGYITSLSIDYSSQEMGYDDKSRPRQVIFNVSFQPINKGLVGRYVE